MKKLFLIFVMSGIAAILCALNGCGSDSTPPNDKPTASAGETQDVNASAAVTLDGSGSSDLNGNALTYAWTQTSGTTVTLSSATAVQPTFTAGSTPQTYAFQLIVNDGTVDSDLATVQIRVWMDATKKLFVNASASAASADGSQTNPYTTISSAITAATAGGEDVYVATGTYTENITMVEGVSLFGGYEATNWTRNITTNATTISPSASDSSTVSAGSGVTASTYINGFTITGPIATSASVYTVSLANGARPTISYNTISGGSSTMNSTVIYCAGSGNGLTISNNTITTGTTTSSDTNNVTAAIAIQECTNVTISGNTISGSSNSSYSAAGGVDIVVVRNSSSATIELNTINAGKNTANYTQGIEFNGAASGTISRNRINGGDGIVSGTSAAGSTAIMKQSTGDMVIENNIIYAGDGYSTDVSGNAANSYGVVLGGSDGTSNVVNNTIYMGGYLSGSNLNYGIFALGTTKNIINNLIIQDPDKTALSGACLLRLNITEVAPSLPFNSVLNNDFKTVTDGMIYLYSTGGDPVLSTTVSAMVTELATEGTSAANTTGNVAVDPILQTGSDYLLSSSSTLIGAGYSGSLVTLPTVDYDGNVRPTSTGYDIGADQY